LTALRKNICQFIQGCQDEEDDCDVHTETECVKQQSVVYCACSWKKEDCSQCSYE